MEAVRYQVHLDSLSLPLAPRQAALTRRRSHDDHLQYGYRKPSMCHSSVEVLADGTHRHLLGRPPSESTPVFDGLVKVLGQWRSKSHSLEQGPLIPTDAKIGSDSLASLTKKYGRCTDILHYGSSCTVRLYAKRVAIPSHPVLSSISPTPSPTHPTAAAWSDSSRQQVYAVKVFRRPSLFNVIDSQHSEHYISTHVQHPNLIETRDVLCNDRGDLCLVMDYCDGGDLHSLLRTSGNIDALEADCFFKQLMRAVNYLHDEQGIAHRDINTENILLTHDGMVKLADFGAAEFVRDDGGFHAKRMLQAQTGFKNGAAPSKGNIKGNNSESRKARQLCGTVPYIAPEEFTDSALHHGGGGLNIPKRGQGPPDGRRGDIWAAGMVYMAMRTGRLLWRIAHEEGDARYGEYLRGRQDRDGYLPIEKLCKRRCCNVVYAMLSPNPERRITAAQVLRSEWLHQLAVCHDRGEG